jgi:Tfp pilus assembly protein PilE
MSRELRHDQDAGTTLVEMLVVMIVFTIILGIITSAIIAMLHQQQKENGQANNLDASRKVIEALDHSTRYANAITSPGTGTDGGSYVEWQVGNAGQQQTCYQWRYEPSTGYLQSRSWQPPLTGSGSVTPTGWSTEATGISLTGATPIWSITPALAADVSANTKEQLTVSFTSTSGTPSSSSASQVTLTAINSTSEAAPTGASAVCTQVGRP